MDFPLGKMEFWAHWEFYPYSNKEYLTLGKSLLTRLYLKERVHITNLLSVHNLQKSDALNEINWFRFSYFWGFLWPWKLMLIVSNKWTFSFVSISLMTYLSCIFLLNISIFTTIDDDKEGKNTFL